MMNTRTVERTSKYAITKAELESLILHEINPSMDDGIASHVKVTFEYNVSGGYDGYGHENNGSGRWEPYVFSGLTVTITEKT